MQHNADLLAQANFDMSTLLNTQQGTHAWHGSEFRPISHLKRFLHHHPLFTYFETHLHHRHGLRFLTCHHRRRTAR